jgi:hypothetical protein
MIDTPVIPGFEGQKIVYKPAGLVTPHALLVNGLPAEKGPKRGEMLLTRNDGQKVIATFKGGVFDAPKLAVGNLTVDLVKPLKWYYYAWSGLPILLAILGGAIGAITGFIAFSTNMQIFRSERGTLAKFGLTALVSLAAVMAYLVLVTLITALIQRPTP